MQYRFAHRVIRDPLTHFVIAGALLFVAYLAFGPEGRPASHDPMTIELTEGDIRQIALVWQAQGRAPPNPEQLRRMAEEEALQRILAREAMALGLDQDDEIIARRLAQKMDFLLADLATLDEPDEAELRVWYARNQDRFAIPPRASFRHLYFSLDKRGADGARDAATKLLREIGKLRPDDERPAKADRFMFRDYYGGRSPDEITKEFGPGFAEDLFRLKTGEWQGPIRSGYGWHLVWIDSMEPGHAADFTTVEQDVRAAWLGERYQKIKQRAYDEMRSRYTIVIPEIVGIDFSSPPAGKQSGPPETQ